MPPMDELRPGDGLAVRLCMTITIKGGHRPASDPVEAAQSPTQGSRCH
jgi:hypothetical protein